MVSVFYFYINIAFHNDSHYQIELKSSEKTASLQTSGHTLSPYNQIYRHLRILIQDVGSAISRFCL